jgi:hypothetical protein
MASALESAVALPFRLGSALRRARLHPDGLLCRGDWEFERGSALAPAAEVLRTGARHRVVAQVSRDIG